MERSNATEFMIGLTLGSVTALLFAPRSGKKTRSWIGETATEGASYVKDRGENVLHFIEHSKDKIVRHKQSVAQALKQCTYAYKRAVS